MIKWSDLDLLKIEKLLEDDRPLFMFIGDDEKIIECEWFDSAVDALNHARSLPFPIVNVFMMTGYVENEIEDYGLV